MKNTTPFPHYEVEIPCRVVWQESSISASLSRISCGGAQVSRATAIPPEASSIDIEFEFEGRPFSLKAQLRSRVVYSVQEILEEGGAGFFGVEFGDPPEEIGTRLVSLFKSIENRQRIDRPS